MSKTGDDDLSSDPDQPKDGLPEQTGPKGKLKTFASFSAPAYRVYYGSLVGNWGAMSMQMITRSLLIYRLTGSAAMIGVVALANALPSLVISLLGGALADRFEKKLVLLAGRIISAISALAVALALSTGYLSAAQSGSWWVLIVSAILQGIGNGFVQPANMAIIPELVGKERVMNAISLSNMGQQGFRLIGPTAAGFLIDTSGFAAVYYLMGGFYLLSAGITLFLPRIKVTFTSQRNTFGDILEGFRYLRGEAIIMVVVIFSVCHVVAGQPYQQMLAVFTDDILKVGASGMGILNSVAAAGALVISVVIASLPNKKRGLLLLLSGVIMGAGVMIFAFSKCWILSLLVMPFAGIGPTLHSTMTATIVQTHVEPNYRSRMQSFVTMAGGLASFGTFMTGVLTDMIGPQWAVGGMAIFLLSISVVFIIFAPKLRKLE